MALRAVSGLTVPHHPPPGSPRSAAPIKVDSEVHNHSYVVACQITYLKSQS